MKNKKKLTAYIILCISIVLSIPLGQSASTVKCIDDNTLQITWNYTFLFNNVNLGNLSIPVSEHCDFGCDNVTSTCSPSQLNMTLWTTGGIFGFLFVIGLLIKLWKGR